MLRSIGFICLVIFFISVMVGGKAFCKERRVVLEYDFSEGAGDILKDKSGNENDGVIHGAKWVKEDKGYSLYFDGVDDYVEVKHSPSLEIGEEFTIEALVKLEENPKKQGFGTFRLIVGKNGEFWDANSSFALYVTEENRSFTGYIRYGPKKSEEENEVYEVSKGVRRVDSWQKLVLVKTKGNLKLSVNSVLFANKDIPEDMIPYTRSLMIGGILARFFHLCRDDGR